MLTSSPILGILFATAAAISWGGGDFSGGLASRRQNQYQVIFQAFSFSFVLLVILAIIKGESLLSMRDGLISFIAGAFGSLGLAALYHGLSRGRAALIAPVAGVVGVIVPILVGIVTLGNPSMLQFLGFVFALAGIWLVSSKRKNNWDADRVAFGLGFLAGLGFGGFLVLMPQLEGDQVFFPLVIARISGVLLSIFMTLRTKVPFPQIKDTPMSLLTGLLDTGGNFFYLTSAAYAHIEIIAVVSSLYPAATVLLSRLILKENIFPRQWFGILICIIAIGLLTI